MRLKLVALILLTISLIATLAFAHKAQDVKKQVQGVQPKSSEMTQADARANVTEALLKQQLQQAQDYDNKLLSTVYWSLSGVFLVVVLVAGFNLVAGFRTYERDRDSLKLEIQNTLYAETAKLNESFGSLRREINETSTKNRRSLDEAITKFSDALEARIEEIKKSAERAGETAANRLERKMNETEYDNASMRMEFYLTQGSYQIYKAIDAWMVRAKMRQSSGWLGINIAKYHIDDLHKILGAAKNISYSREKDLLEVLNGFPPELMPEIEKIKTTLKGLAHD